MKKRNINYCIIICFISFFIIQGCAYTVPQIQKQGEIIKVGMSKDEVLAVWGKPYHKWLQEQSISNSIFFPVLSC